MAQSSRHSVAIRSLEETAQEMGITKDSVENIERRAIKKAKRLLLEWYGITPDYFNFEGRVSAWDLME